MCGWLFKVPDDSLSEVKQYKKKGRTGWWRQKKVVGVSKSEFQTRRHQKEFRVGRFHCKPLQWLFKSLTFNCHSTPSTIFHQKKKQKSFSVATFLHQIKAPQKGADRLKLELRANEFRVGWSVARHRKTFVENFDVQMP